MTSSPGSQQYYTPQPAQSRLQLQFQTYEAPVRFQTPSVAQSMPQYGGHSLSPAASLTLPPLSNFSVSHSGPHFPPNETGRAASSSHAGVGSRNSTPSNLFRFGGDTGGPFGHQKSLPSMSRSSTPAAASRSLNPLGYAQHDFTPKSSGFNSRQIPAFDSPQSESFLRTPRPPFSQSQAPASRQAQPYLQTPKPAPSFLQAPKPKPARLVPVTWDEPIVNHNFDAQNLRSNIPPPLPLPPPGNSPTPAARPFRPPSMSIQSSSQSRSFHDMHHQVHSHQVDAPVSRPTTSLSHHSPSITIPPSSPPCPSPSIPRPSSSFTRPATPPSHSSTSARHSSSSIAKLMNPSSSSRDEEGSEAENPVPRDAESNWALAEQLSLATASKPSLGEGEHALKSRTTDATIAEACAQLLTKHDQEWLDLVKNKGWSIERVRRVREIRARVNGMRDPTPYQAGLFHLTRKLNTTLPAGQKLKLQDLHHRLKANQKVMAEVKKGNRSLKVKKWVQEVKEHRAAKLVGTRGSSKGIRKAGTNGYKNLKNAADNLSATTGALTFGIVCRSEFGTPVTSGLYGSGNMEHFLQDTFKVSAFDFLLSAESYSCMAHVNGKRLDGVDKLKVAIVGMILKGLRISTGQPKLQMEYKHYRVKLMQKWHVRLTGWPDHIPFLNAHDLKDAEVKELYKLLRSATVRWEVMNNREYEKEMVKLAHDIKKGELEPPTRGPRSDKGKKHKTSKLKKTSKNDTPDSTLSTSSGKTKSKKPTKSTNQGKRARDEQDNGRGSNKRAKTSNNQQRSPKSREVLTDTDNSNDNSNDGGDDNNNGDNGKEEEEEEEEVDPLDEIAAMGMDEDEEDELDGSDELNGNDEFGGDGFGINDNNNGDGAAAVNGKAGLEYQRLLWDALRELARLISQFRHTFKRSEEESNDDEDQDQVEAKEDVEGKTETNLVDSQCTVYLTIMNALHYEEAVLKLLKIQLSEGTKVMLVNMVIEHCFLVQSYSTFNGLIGERFNRLNRVQTNCFEPAFVNYYTAIHTERTVSRTSLGSLAIPSPLTPSPGLYSSASKSTKTTRPQVAVSYLKNAPRLMMEWCPTTLEAESLSSDSDSDSFNSDTLSDSSSNPDSLDTSNADLLSWTNTFTAYSQAMAALSRHS
ncbi:pre-mRNA-splicing factor cwc22 [Marasmius tenuissimus]|uniref:Pre-mRNA-splicing factor cwc22 n=1 Tax=Marasmius tenuissimus TaxID=585030 RepID=A0ABR3A9B9_9AGAR